MNINSMIMKIDAFNEYIVESGFIRDIQEFIKTISQAQNSQNIVLLKDITDRVIGQLIVIQASDVPDYIDLLITKEDTETLKLPEHIQALTDLINDTQVDTADYYARLTNSLNSLVSQISVIQEELDSLHDVLFPFYEKGRTDSENAVISFIFKDINTTSNLKNFAKVLNRWNRTLHIYHQLVSSKKPKDIELVNIQNGSLDVVLNMNIDVAMNLT